METGQTELGVLITTDLNLENCIEVVGLEDGVVDVLPGAGFETHGD